MQGREKHRASNVYYFSLYYTVKICFNFALSIFHFFLGRIWSNYSFGGNRCHYTPSVRVGRTKLRFETIDSSIRQSQKFLSVLTVFEGWQEKRRLQFLKNRILLFVILQREPHSTCPKVNLNTTQKRSSKSPAAWCEGLCWRCNDPHSTAALLPSCLLPNCLTSTYLFTWESLPCNTSLQLGNNCSIRNATWWQRVYDLILASFYTCWVSPFVIS